MPFKTHYSQKSMTCPQFALELGKANKSRNDLEAQVAALQASQADLLQKVAKNSDLIKTLTKGLLR
jgi:succinylglutamate desuccinylase